MSLPIVPSEARWGGDRVAVGGVIGVNRVAHDPSGPADHLPNFVGEGKKGREDRMLTSGRVVFTKMEEVHYGKPAAQSIAELVKEHGAERVFLMVSGTLNRETDEVEKVRRALGNKCVGTFDRMPAHSPRSAVVAAAAQAREAKADMIVTLGGGSITDGAKAVQLCLANDATTVDGMDRIRGTSDVKPPTVRQVSLPTPLSARGFSGPAGGTTEANKGEEVFLHPLAIPQ